MSPNTRVRKVQVSIKLPQDIEKKVRAAVDNDEYANMTDAITGMLRLYFQRTEVERLREMIEEMKSEIGVLKMRNEHLEKIVCELMDKNTE